MGLIFNRGSDDENCSHHHWDEYRPDWDHLSIQVEKRSVTPPAPNTERVRVVRISVPMVRLCQHEGCSATDRRTTPRNYYIPQRAVGTSIESAGEMNDLLEAAYDEEGELTAEAQELIAE